MRTPLHAAVIMRNEAAVTTLLEHGADVHAVDEVGCSVWEFVPDANLQHQRTPLHYALTGFDEIQITIPKLLLEHAADPNAKDLVRKCGGLLSLGKICNSAFQSDRMGNLH